MKEKNARAMNRKLFSLSAINSVFVLIHDFAHVSCLSKMLVTTLFLRAFIFTCQESFSFSTFLLSCGCKRFNLVLDKDVT